MSERKIDLLQGTLDLLVLKMLQAGAANGWDVMQRVQLLSSNVIQITPGSLYPALHRLEARGWVVSQWGASEKNRRAKFYKLSAAGRRQLAAERQAWERFSEAMTAILDTP